MKTKLAIFASGTGSNALKILEYFEEHNQIEVVLILSNKKEAKVLDYASLYQTNKLVVKKKEFLNEDFMLNTLKLFRVDFIVLAGFLWLIPKYLVHNYKNKIVNIHPSLLPQFGGKGMYGMNVHRAVKDSKESISGMTIHYVNEHFDEGEIIFQAKCELDESDSPEMIAQKVLQLEHQHYAPIIESVIIN